MAKSMIAGFVKGFTGNSLDRIQERRQNENELKKAKMLAQLQSETRRSDFLFEEGYKKSNKIDENMSTKDYETGRITMRALDGTELGARDMNASEKKAYQDEQAKLALDMEGKRATIDSSRASAESSRASAARSRRLDASDAKATKAEPDDFDRANELIYRYKNEVQEAVAQGNISQTAVREGAVALIENSRNGQEAQAKFLDFLSNYRTGRKKTDQHTRPKPLDGSTQGW